MAHYAESWLNLEAATGGRVPLQGDASDVRKQFASLFGAISQSYPAPSDKVKISDGLIHGTRYRVYTPVTEGVKNPLPLGVYTHGGGFILGDLEMEDLLCREFAEKANTILVSVDYRLAPEHKHPIQLQDTLTVLEWAYANASSLGADQKKVFTVGTSAGATLAILAAREIISGRSQVPAAALCGIVSVGPITAHPDNIPAKYQAGHKSYDEFGEGAPVLTRSVMLQFLQYANLTPEDASAFLLLEDHIFRDFPPVYIATAECDPLRDDGRNLAAALKDAGASVREDMYRGMPHCFWFFNGLSEWSVFIENTAAAIRWIHGEKT